MSDYKRTGLISMFLQGSGLSSAQIDKVYAEPRVKIEMEQTPLDARGVYDAIYSAARINSFTELAADLTGPTNMIFFMNIIDAVNEKL